MNGQQKARLLTLDALDQRTIAAKQVKDTISTIESDLGGDLSTAERQIVQRAAITGAVLEDMAAKWLTGGEFDAALWATLSNVERRLYETIGLQRRTRDITPSVSEYLAQKTPTEEK